MTEADARLLATMRAREAHFQRWMGPDGCANESQLDRRFLLRLLDEAAATQQWQPIETAPKDRIIDLWCHFSKTGGADYGERATDCEWDDENGWVDEDGDSIGWGPDQYGQQCRVTHWMPLPELPK